MEPIIIAAIIGASGAVLAAAIRLFPPGWLARVLGTPAGHLLLGDWASSWGPLPNGPVDHHELVSITRQRGDKVWGVVTRREELDKKWRIEGRYDGHFLQMYYFPAPDSKNIDFLDYGCYFFERKANSFVGYSTGFGSDDADPEGYISTDYHVMHRGARKP